MAHLINFDATKGTHSFASYKEKAWHGLGQIVENAMTSAQAIELANMDYEVARASMHAKIGEEFVEVTDRFSNYRTDTNVHLGTVGERYEIVQNKDAFGFFDAIIDSGEAIFETAGVLGKGQKIFVTAKLPDDMLVHGEACNKYIILTNSHDGTSSVIAGFTTVRVVCNNTLQAALGRLTNKVYIQHKLGAKERIQEAHKVMGIASTYMSEINEIFNQMAKTPISDDNLKNYIVDVMTAENKEEIKEEKVSSQFIKKVNDAYAFALTHPTQQTDATRGTVWGAYNTISGYFNYIQKYNSDEHKFASQMFGHGNSKIGKAFDIACKMV